MCGKSFAREYAEIIYTMYRIKSKAIRTIKSRFLSFYCTIVSIYTISVSEVHLGLLLLNLITVVLQRCRLPLLELLFKQFFDSETLVFVSLFFCQILCVISLFLYSPCRQTFFHLKRTSLWPWLSLTPTAVWSWSGIISKWISENLTTLQVCYGLWHQKTTVVWCHFVRKYYHCPV